VVFAPARDDIGAFVDAVELAPGFFLTLSGRAVRAQVFCTPTPVDFGGVTAGGRSEISVLCENADALPLELAAEVTDPERFARARTCRTRSASTPRPCPSRGRAWT
jgi:hypothetical protein